MPQQNEEILKSLLRVFEKNPQRPLTLHEIAKQIQEDGPNFHREYFKSALRYCMRTHCDVFESPKWGVYQLKNALLLKDLAKKFEQNREFSVFSKEDDSNSQNEEEDDDEIISDFSEINSEEDFQLRQENVNNKRAIPPKKHFLRPPKEKPSKEKSPEEKIVEKRKRTNLDLEKERKKHGEKDKSFPPPTEKSKLKSKSPPPPQPQPLPPPQKRQKLSKQEPEDNIQAPLRPQRHFPQLRVGITSQLGVKQNPPKNESPQTHKYQLYQIGLMSNENQLESVNIEDNHSILVNVIVDEGSNAASSSSLCRNIFTKTTKLLQSQDWKFDEIQQRTAFSNILKSFFSNYDEQGSIYKRDQSTTTRLNKNHNKCLKDDFFSLSINVFHIKNGWFINCNIGNTRTILCSIHQQKELSEILFSSNISPSIQLPDQTRNEGLFTSNYQSVNPLNDLYATKQKMYGNSIFTLVDEKSLKNYPNQLYPHFTQTNLTDLSAPRPLSNSNVYNVPHINFVKLNPQKKHALFSATDEFWNQLQTTSTSIQNQEILELIWENFSQDPNEIARHLSLKKDKHSEKPNNCTIFISFLGEMDSKLLMKSNQFNNVKEKIESKKLKTSNSLSTHPQNNQKRNSKLTELPKFDHQQNDLNKKKMDIGNLIAHDNENDESQQFEERKHYRIKIEDELQQLAPKYGDQQYAMQAWLKLNPFCPIQVPIDDSVKDAQMLLSLSNFPSSS